jgi:dihydroorotate dehydrogenase (fumarate)
VTGLADWLQQHGYTSVSEARGAMSARSVADPAAYARANYLDEITRAVQQFRRR